MAAAAVMSRFTDALPARRHVRHRLLRPDRQRGLLVPVLALPVPLELARWDRRTPPPAASSSARDIPDTSARARRASLPAAGCAWPRTRPSTGSRPADNAAPGLAAAHPLRCIRTARTG